MTPHVTAPILTPAAAAAKLLALLWEDAPEKEIVAIKVELGLALLLAS